MLLVKKLNKQINKNVDNDLDYNNKKKVMCQLFLKALWAMIVVLYFDRKVYEKMENGIFKHTKHKNYNN